MNMQYEELVFIFARKLCQSVIVLGILGCILILGLIMLAHGSDRQRVLKGWWSWIIICVC